MIFPSQFKFLEKFHIVLIQILTKWLPPNSAHDMTGLLQYDGLEWSYSEMKFLSNLSWAWKILSEMGPSLWIQKNIFCLQYEQALVCNIFTHGKLVLPILNLLNSLRPSDEYMSEN